MQRIIHQDIYSDWVSRNFKRAQKEIPVILFCLFVTLVEIRFRIVDVEMSMASARLDDNPVVASFVLNSSNFQNDHYARMISDTGIQSVFFLIPILLLQTDLVGTSSVWLALVFIQRFVLLYAVTRFTKFLTESNWARFMAVLFVSTAQPYYWNLAWLGDNDLTPYAFWMALGLGLWAYSELLQKNYLKFQILFAFAFLTHITFGIQLAILFFVIIVKNQYPLLRKFSLEFLVLNLVFLIPYFRLRNLQVDMPERIWNIVKENGHLKYYNYFESQFAFGTLKNYLILSAVTLIALSTARKLRKENSQLLLPELLITGALLFFHHIAVEIEFKPAMSFFGPRFTVFLGLILAIRCIAIFTIWIQSPERVQRILGMTIFLLPAVSLLGVCAAITLTEYAKGKRLIHVFRSALLALFIGLSLIPALAYTFNLLKMPNRFFDYSSDLYTSFLNPLQLGFVSFLVPGVLTNNLASIMVFVITSVLFLGNFSRNQEIANKRRRLSKTGIEFEGKFLYFLIPLVLFWVITVGFNFQYQYSYSLPIQKISEIKSLQKWVKLNTEETAMFSVPTTDFPGWRTLTERPAASLSGLYPPYVYFSYIEELNKAIEEYWKRPSSTSLDHPKGTWDEYFYCAYKFQKIDYIVSTKQEKFSFPKVYESTNYSIFKVRCKE